ncbi:bifunctional molybdopterin-guanine dinucleotide biosynthesis adaptor protein MobB/molybdopterin molybdotransferase MoeA [Aeromonas enteropelogenes]|uniref:bifunctional molybdopterin-guanine dinucleotide biosynthesis adaptor protein MobB/molybdopterin molybdotransferase MoeA n=1 Tax=Aeromonas enteropelogenes TaxID=29489 RepID=UPI001CE29946|nr:bifunctional molybdopterin-guanine dinucleotide biosynthesis adaptor protein MobB/molybdopterin molybdotransferase MoeA [Aeromonas enteropelogenes]UCA10628.1 bifunctional molybdopterin-guanine dinucleotide biosynthesis adaptor protein MobB/molybdopterin molybdotransferase MoeA [Aeromonas enteropelogenes]
MTPAPTLPLLGFAAWSGTGKTTLLEQLIPLLVARGLRLGVLKHAHHDFDIDQPGKDSHRLRKAGANQMMVASRRRHARIIETELAEADFRELLASFDQTCLDLLLVEGFKHEHFPKIELHRAAIGKPLLFPDDRDIIAVASDQPADTTLPRLDINDLDAIADFVCDYLAGCQTREQGAGNGFLSVEAARDTILAALTPSSGSTLTPLTQCHGAVLAADLVSPINVPPHANSAMDGVGLRSDDLAAGRWQLVGEVLAGQQRHEPVLAGQAVQIMTGAPVPPGVDTVVMREETVMADGWVTIQAPIKAGQNVRQAGEDLAKGAVAIPAGTRLGAPQLGLAASLGQAALPVRTPLKVALFSTGDEVQAPGETLAPGHIFDSNRFTLMALIRGAGCEVMDLGIIPDDQAVLRQRLAEAAASADLVLSSGGVSVGNADYIKGVLAELGQIDFWRIQMRPGRPLAFGKLGDTPFFGLPGNPVAAMICFLQFVEPAIARLQGRSWQPLRLSALASERMKSRPGRTEFLRGVFHQDGNGELRVRTTGPQGSGILSSMAEANCLIEIVPSQPGIAIGERVWIHPLQGRLA